MSIAKLLKTASEAGVFLFCEDGKLGYKLTVDSFPESIKEQVKAKKTEIIAYLTEQTSINSMGKEQAAISPVDRDGLLAMSFAQQRLWFIDQLQSGTPEYNMPAAINVNGRINKDILANVFREIITRHEVLRTVYVEQDGVGYQRINKEFNFSLAEHDLRSLPEEIKQETLASLIKQNASQVFDLANDLMLKASYVDIDNNSGMILFNMHHIASDGWSIQLLIKEFMQLYSAYSNGKSSPLAELKLQYGDYASWQRTWLNEQELARQLDYWKSQLADAPPVHELVTCNPRSAGLKVSTAALQKRLTKAVSQPLLSVAKHFRLTPFMLGHALLSLVLARHSQQNKIVVGTPIANRLQEELVPLIGFFTNTLVLAAEVNHQSLAQYFNHIRDLHLDAQTYQNVPFEQLVDALKIPRSKHYSPVFQILLTTSNDFGVSEKEPASFPMPELTFSVAAEQEVQTKFEITIDISINENGVAIKWLYNQNLFEAKYIERLNQHLCNLLTWFARQAETAAFARLSEVRLTDISIYSKNEAQLLTQALSGQHSEATDWKSISRLFEQQVAVTPDAIALICEDQKLTFSELNQRSNQLAHYLLETYKLKPDSLVGLCTERSVELVIGILAILKAGGAYVPMDPGYPKERLEYVVKDTAAELILSHKAVLPVVEAFNTEILLLDALPEAVQHYPVADVSHVQPGKTDLAYVIYTSGSTGKPKGVMVTHGGVSNLAQSMKSLQLGEKGPVDSNWGWIASYAFDASVQGLTQLCLGQGLVILGDEAKRDLNYLIRQIQQHNIGVLDCTPALLSLWRMQAPAGSVIDARIDVDLVIGGEAIDDDLWQDLVSWQDKNNNLYRAFNVYGPTECTVNSCWTQITGDTPNLGGMLPNTYGLVLDAQRNLTPMGAVGELYIGGSGVARGYLNRELLTTERFINNPFPQPDGMLSSGPLYRTGDLVRLLSDGSLCYEGRADDQVKIRGFRIEPGEISSTLNQLDYVDSSLVMARNIAGSPQLVAWLKLAEGVSDGPKLLSRVKQHLLQCLPAYMVPEIMQTVVQWPLTPNGKIDKKALPDFALAGQVRDYVAPRTATERALLPIWADLLGLEADSLSVTANFFELGGHSLLSVRLIARIREQLSLEVSVPALYEFPSIAGIGQWLDENQSGVVRSKVTAVARPDGTEQTSFSQQRLWFIDQLQGGSPEYHMPSVFEVKGRLDLTLVEGVFKTIIERHEVLRTVYFERDGQALQRILPLSEVAFSLRQLDVSGLTRETQDKQMSAFRSEICEQPFDLSQELMLRVGYIHTGSDSGLLLLNMHHIASDGWSMDVLSQEFFSLYQAYEAGQDNPLAPLSIQYADYARWQRETLSGELLETQLAYWTEQLAELPAVHSLPLDHSRPVRKQHQGAQVKGQLDGDVAGRLQALARRYNMTPFMLLHGALSLVLSRHSNSYDIVIGTPVANRLQAEVEPLIGFFVNTLVLRLDTRQATLVDYLRHVREVNLQAQANQDVPFEQLVERLQIPRSQAHSPLFQIMLSSNNDYGVQTSGQEMTYALPEVSFSAYRDGHVQAKFDLDITLSLSEQGVGLDWVYDTALFSEQRISALNGQLMQMLQSIAAAEADTRLAALEMLSAEETHQLLSMLPGPRRAYPQEQCIHHLFEAQAAAHPEATALVYGKQRLSYQALNERANQLAHYLLAHYEITPDSFVGLCVNRSPEMVVAILAILKAGGAYVPLDPSYPQERLNYIMADVKPKLVLVQKALLQKVEFQKETEHSHILQFEALFCTEGGALSCNDEVAKFSVCNPRISHLTSTNLVYLLYTSGSTGKPKGVMIQHKAVVNYQQHIAECYAIDRDDRVLQFSNIAFDIFVEEYFGALCHGATLVLRDESCLEGARAFSDFCSKNRISVVSLPTSFWLQLNYGQDVVESPLLRMVIVGGEALPYRATQDFFNKTQHAVSLINSYGPTEATITACTFSMQELPDGESIPIGKANANYSLLVLGPNLEFLPIGAIGELFIGGDSIALGYLNQSEETQERFIENPHYNERYEQLPKRIYRSGDLVQLLPDGNLLFEGRVDEQVKIRGFRIEPAEVTAALESITDVDSALVVVQKQGESQKLVAYVKPAVKPDFEQRLVSWLHEAMKNTVPQYMRPDGIVLVEHWPLTPNGKIDKKQLPAFTGDKNDDEYIAPGSQTEILLVEIWARLLQLDERTIGIRDNFFELGGHSLLSIKLMVEIRSAFSIELPVPVLYANPTIESLASCLFAQSMSDSGELASELSQQSETNYQFAERQAKPHGPASPEKPFVTLADTSGKPPLFFFPGVGLDSSSFIPCVKYLKQEFAIKSFEFGDVDGINITYNDLDEIISVCAQEIQCSTKGDIVYLVGHSFGGCIAFELARKLEACGMQVGLVLLDCYLYQDKALKNNSLADEAIELLHSRTKARALDEHGCQHKTTKNKKYDLLKMMQNEFGNADPDLLSTILENKLLALQKQIEIWQGYQPYDAFKGKINLICASKGLAVEGESELKSGYQPYSQQPVAVQSTPGEHLSMLAMLNAQALSENIRRAFG